MPPQSLPATRRDQKNAWSGTDWPATGIATRWSTYSTVRMEIGGFWCGIAYLGWLEVTLRDLSGDPEFALPYWTDQVSGAPTACLKMC